jgi:hypothetical protein
MDLLTLLIVVLVIAWLTGAFIVPVGGSLIHLLLVVILVIIVIRVLRGQSL